MSPKSTCGCTVQGGSKCSLVEMGALKINKVEDEHAVLTINIQASQSVSEMSQTLGVSPATASRYLLSIE